MRYTVIIGWIVSVTALVTMVMGHLGDHELSWKVNQISTYAAIAPYDHLVTASMLLSTAAFLIIGILISKHGLLGSSYLVQLVPLLSGCAASGLVMLAYYEETSRTLTILKSSGFWSIRQQSFHDAGLQIFFYSAVLLVTVLGISVILYSSKAVEKLLGIGVLSLSPGSFLLMTTAWPNVIGVMGATAGLQQRVSLLCLWLAMIFLLAIASNKSRQPTAASAGLSR